MRIVQTLFDSSATSMVSFARDGKAFTELRRDGRNVGSSILLPEGDGFHQFLNVDASGEYGFSRVDTRNYLRAVAGQGGADFQSEPAIEALFVNITAKSIERISNRGKEQPLAIGVDAGSCSCLRTSRDGRYVAVGDGYGKFELWHMDMTPQRYYSCGFQEECCIAELCYSRTNLEIFIATSCGTMYRIDVPRNNVYALHTDSQWPCYSIDCQPAGDGLVFAGEGRVVWFLNLPNAPYDKRVAYDDLPFGMEQAEMFTGKTFWRVAGMPAARVGCLKTGVGAYVQQARFLSNELVALLGPTGTEVWDVSGEEPQMVARQSHNPDCRLLGFGGDTEEVRVSLGRPM